MGSTYSRRGTDIEGPGLGLASIHTISESDVYNRLDHTDRLFFYNMIVQGNRYTSFMPAEEIVNDIIENMEYYVYDGILMLAWFTDDDIELDLNTLQRPLKQIVMREDQNHYLIGLNTHGGINIQYVDD